MTRTGSNTTSLIIIRGNSGSGKSAIAREIRQRWEQRGLAIVGQDMIRRDIFRVRDEPGNPTCELIDLTARLALDRGYHVVVEGILSTETYGDMLRQLVADHIGTSNCYYMDIPFAETLRRHATKPQAAEYGEEAMRRWFRPNDRLGTSDETVLAASLSLDESVEIIMRGAGLLS